MMTSGCYRGAVLLLLASVFLAGRQHQLRAQVAPSAAPAQPGQSQQVSSQQPPATQQAAGELPVNSNNSNSIQARPFLASANPTAASGAFESPATSNNNHVNKPQFEPKLGRQPHGNSNNNMMQLQQQQQQSRLPNIDIFISRSEIKKLLGEFNSFIN